MYTAFDDSPSHVTTLARDVSARQSQAEPQISSEQLGGLFEVPAGLTK
jgi:hypothetical protein